jgi:hypothetical protein
LGVRSWHVARAEYHKTVAEHLRHETEYEDWALVALYYSALHFVDSVLADDPDLNKDERHPRKHSGQEPGARGRNLLVNSRCRPIRGDYRKLEELSRRTRYDADMLRTESVTAYDKALPQWHRVEQWARMMHITRPAIPSEQP